MTKMGNNQNETDEYSARRFYRLLDREIAGAGYSQSERSMLADPFLYYGRYLDPSTRDYFCRTVLPVIDVSSRILQTSRAQTVLDLGCGLGMQSLLFASMGMRVIAIDLRPDSIALCKKRKDWYEAELECHLPVEFVSGNFLEMDLSAWAESADATFSMSAFSYIVPIQQTIERIAAVTQPQATVILFEENPDHWIGRYSKSADTPGTKEVARTFNGLGFERVRREGVCALPKQFWQIDLLNGFVEVVDKTLRRAPPLAISNLTVFERRR